MLTITLKVNNVYKTMDYYLLINSFLINDELNCI